MLPYGNHLPPGAGKQAGALSVFVGMQSSLVASQPFSCQLTTGASTLNTCPPMMRLPVGRTSLLLCQKPQLRRADPDGHAVLERDLGHAHPVDVRAVRRVAIVEPDAGRIDTDLRVLARGVAVVDHE